MKDMGMNDPSWAESEVAVIGLAGRFPGAKNVDEFWQNLRDGVESVSFFSDEELKASGVDPNLLSDPSYVKAGAVLEGLDLFDAPLFGFSAREAELTDPQHRLLLECAWEALESAGYNPEHYAGVIGVYASVGLNRYVLLHPSSVFDPRNVAETYQVFIGNDKDFAATRLSFKLNLKGPSMTVQTACSSSLVAVHLACQSLINGECDMVLAGGVALQSLSKTGYFYQGGMILSPDGHCRAFDAKAQGTVFGSGVGMVVLRRLADAIADGDSIHAVIKGSAVNNDGALKVGYTAPSVDGQAEVIAEALAVAQLDPETVTYIETHGTGTPLGDPIEIAALTQAYGAHVTKKEHFAIGSVKTNIGHLDTASGVAGLIKTILALKHKALPPSLHFEQPNPHIDFANIPFYVNARLSEWKSHGSPLRAGVSSFGIGGTNAHVIVEEAPQVEAPAASRPWQLVVLSAATASALEATTRNVRAHLKEHAGLNLADVAYTLQRGRKALRHRRVVVCQDLEDAVNVLEGLDSQRVISGESQEGEPPIMFMFPGQGTQHRDMALGLYQGEPFFRAQIDRCAELLQPHLGLDVRQLLYPKEAQQIEDAERQLNETAITQPALFVIEYALARLWMEWGVVPQAMLGHSIGEYVAACLAGVFPLEDALAVVARRGQLMQQLPPGAMLAVQLSEQEVRHRMSSQVWLAAINGPSQCVVAGLPDAVTQFEHDLERVGIRCRRLRTSHAFHSKLMDPILEEFTDYVARVELHHPQIPYLSNVTGTWITATEATDPGYWANHLRHTVRFADGVKALLKDPELVIIEVGPGQALRTLVTLQPDYTEARVVVSSLAHRPEHYTDMAHMLHALGRLWLAGVSVDWARFHAHERRYRVPLPTYPFEGQRYWLESSGARRDASSVDTSATHQGSLVSPVLGRRLRSPLKDIQFESRLHTKLDVVNAHRIYGAAVVAGAMYVSMALDAAREVFGSLSCRLEEVIFSQPLVIPEDASRTVQLVLSPEGDAGASFQVLSSPEEDDESSWTLHAAGKLRIGQQGMSSAPERPSREEIRARCQEQVSGEKQYNDVEDIGFHTGGSFRWIEQMWRRDGEALCQMRLPQPEDGFDHYRLHPGLIDSLFLGLPFSLLSNLTDMHVPIGFENFRFYGLIGPGRLWSWVKARPIGEQEAKAGLFVGDLCLFDDAGHIVAEVRSLNYRRAPREVLLGAYQGLRDEWVYEVAWRPVERTEVERAVVPISERDRPGRWVVFADRNGLGARFVAALESRGYRCSVVVAGDTYETPHVGRWHIDPASPNNFERLVSDLRQIEGPPCRGVAYLWSLDVTPSETTTVASLEVDQALVCGSVLHLVQALARADWPEAPCLWLVTQGAQATGLESAPVSVGQVPLWGLGRVIASEHPELWGGMVDVDRPQGSGDEAERLIQEILTPGVDDQVVCREGQRLVPRLVRREGLKTHAKSFRCRKDGTYMITGGLGALGLELARWLVERGAEHLVLVGRRGAPPEAHVSVRKLEKAGVQVLIAQGDVSQKQQLARILREIDERLPPVRGIIHAAGVLDDGVLLQQGWNRFTKVLAPKVAGAWNVHLQTLSLPLDFMVLFSSAASLLGNPGQGNYATANAFMDGLAHYRKTLGLPCVSINWGPWDEMGMAATLGDGRKRYLVQRGMDSIPPLQGLEFLAQVLQQQSMAQVALLPIHWPHLLRAFPAVAEAPLFSEMVRETRRREKLQHGSAHRLEDNRPYITTRLKDASPRERDVLLRTYLRQQVADMLNMDLEQVPDDGDLMQLGCDSLMVIEFAGTLQRTLQATIRPAEILSHPSISAVAAHISSQMSATENAGLVHAEARSESCISFASTPYEHTAAPVSSKSAWLPFYQPAPQARLRLFCFPYAGGSAQVYRPWQEVLPVDVQVCEVQLPSRWNRLREPPFTRVASLVTAAVKDLRPYLVEPFAFFGHSLGALVAFEIARALRRQRCPGPVHLYVSGRRAPQIPYAWQDPPLYTLPDSEFLERLTVHYQGVPEKVQQDQELMRLMLPILRADVEAYATYTYAPEPPLDCAISVFGGLDDRTTTAENLEAWREQTSSSFTLERFPGDHFFINDANNRFLNVLGKHLQELVDRFRP